MTNEDAMVVIRNWFGIAEEEDKHDMLSSDEIAEIERTFCFDSDAKSQTIMRLVAHIRAVHANESGFAGGEPWVGKGRSE